MARRDRRRRGRKKDRKQQQKRREKKEEKVLVETTDESGKTIFQYVKKEKKTTVPFKRGFMLSFFFLWMIAAPLFSTGIYIANPRKYKITAALTVPQWFMLGFIIGTLVALAGAYYLAKKASSES